MALGLATRRGVLVHLPSRISKAQSRRVRGADRRWIGPHSGPYGTPGLCPQAPGGGWVGGGKGSASQACQRGVSRAAVAAAGAP